MRLLKCGLSPELEVEVYVPLGAALARPELVTASHRLFVLDLILDHALYNRELFLRQALVQEDAGAPRDQAQSGPQDYEPYHTRDDRVEDRPVGRESGYESQGHAGCAQTSVRRL